MLGKRTFFLMAVVLPLVGVAAMLPLAWLALEALAGSYHEYAARDARANANLLGLTARPLIERGDLDALADLLKKARKGSYTRYTIVDTAGKVLADSDEDPARMENHLHRPEIAAAVAGGEGMDIRHSATLDEELLYVAIPADKPGSEAVIRAAIGLGDVNLRLDVWRRRLLAGAAVGFLAMLALSLLSARMLSKPLERLAAGAERFSQGDFRHRLPETGTGEARLLAASLNRMAAELDSRFGQINRQRRDMRAILASMDDGVVAVDGYGNVLFMNQAAERLLGVSDAATSGRYIGESARQPELLDFIKTAAAGGGTAEREIRLALPSGELWLLARGGALKENGDDSAGGSLIVLHDITRLRRLERVRRDFVANVSHELRTPVTAIQASLETLQDGGLDEPGAARKFLSVALRHSRRLNAIITDLLLLSAMESGEASGLGKTSPGNARTTLEAALQQCRERAAARHVSLDFECPGEISVTANHSLLEQAVVNLVDNAIRHGKADSVVRLHAGTAGDRLRIAVSDSGPGIEPRHAERIFERFYRTGGDREGSGLGLAIVKHIAIAHGGEVSLESTPGVGSTFTFSIPLDSPLRSN